jgi:hypothetical protein
MDPCYEPAGMTETICHSAAGISPRDDIVKSICEMDPRLQLAGMMSCPTLLIGHPDGSVIFSDGSPLTTGGDDGRRRRG